MVRKKSIKNAAVFAMACMIAIGGVITTARAAASGQTHITYDVPESVAFPLTVTAEGNGYVQHGEEKISNSTAGFLLKVDEDKLFGVYPDAGETVQQIVLNGEDITNQLQGTQLTVHGAQKNQTLTVKFSTVTTEATKPTEEPAPVPEETAKPQETQSPDDGNKPTHAPEHTPGGTTAPQTGDSSQVLAYVTFGTASLLGILILISMKRENKLRGE